MTRIRTKLVAGQHFIIMSCRKRIHTQLLETSGYLDYILL